MTHWGPSYYELEGHKHHKKSAAEIAEDLAAAQRAEAFPNVGLEENQDHRIFQYALRRLSDGKIVAILDGQDEPYNFGVMGHCPEGYEVVTRALWPTPWKKSRF